MSERTAVDIQRDIDDKQDEIVNLTNSDIQGKDVKIQTLQTQLNKLNNEMNNLQNPGSESDGDGDGDGDESADEGAESEDEGGVIEPVPVVPVVPGDGSVINTGDEGLGDGAGIGGRRRSRRRGFKGSKKSKSRKGNKMLSSWVAFVKKVQKEEQISYSQAMKRASARKKEWKMGQMGGADKEENHVPGSTVATAPEMGMSGGRRRSKRRGSKKRRGSRRR